MVSFALWSKHQGMIRALLGFVLSLWLAATLAFFALRFLPGNAIDSQLQGSGLSQEAIDARKAALGWDKPLLWQYGDFLWGLLRGDLGLSLYSGQTVVEMIAARLPNTLSLASLGMLLSIVLGIFLGFASAIKNPFRPIFRLLVDLSLAIPVYLSATLALFLLAAYIRGIQSSLLLPVSVLGFHGSGAIARIIASTVTDLETAPFILSARAKGLTEKHIRRVHLLKLALLPAIPVIGAQTGILFSGTVLTESIFGRAGLGVLLLDAVLQRNYPVVQGVVLLSATIYLLSNTLADMLSYWLDPRLRV
jgi:ABC-type dipeptide/oligopeptide/nickel transport system permease component